MSGGDGAKAHSEWAKLIPRLRDALEQSYNAIDRVSVKNETEFKSDASEWITTFGKEWRAAFDAMVLPSSAMDALKDPAICKVN